MDSGEILDGVFNRFACEAKIFVDREVLRHDYIPERLPHREDQIRQIGEIVAPVLTGARSSNILIYGKTGTGKTAVTKYVLGHLEAKAKEFNAPIRVCYVNCRMTGSEYRVFANLCQNMGLHVPFTGLAVGEVFERFRAGLNAAKTLFIVVLDEVDALVKNKSDEFLYELARINETLTGSKLSIVGISNDLRLKEFLDPRVLSSLSEEEIVFRPYDASELRNILAERAVSGFRTGTLSDAALNLCSALAAAEHGDARRALDLLRVAGEVAERKGASIVTEEHVREAEKHIEHNRVVDALKNLTLHSKLVMLSVYHLNKNCARRAVTGEIYEVYTEICGKTGIAPLTQRRFSTIVNELDTMGLLNAKVISMGRYGRTKKIGLEVAVGLVKGVFSEDARLGALVECELSCLAKEKQR